MHPGGQLVEAPDEPHAQVIQDRVGQEHQREEAQDVAPFGRHPEHGSEKLGEAVVDSGGDGELADAVETCGEEPRAAAAQDRRPMIERARRRVARSELREGCGDGQGEERDERTAEGHLERAPHLQPVAVERDRAGEYRDDREAQGEVREPARKQ